MRIIQRNGKDYVFCDWRRKYVRLTPEEGIRQRTLHYLVESAGYPMARIGVEIQLTTGLRADAVIYNQQLQPWMIIEFKAPIVSLSQQTLDQIAVYNRELNVPYLMLCNGTNTLIASVNASSLTFLDTVPVYNSK